MTSTSHDTKILTLSISATAATLVVPSHYLCQFSLYTLTLDITGKVLSMATPLSALPPCQHEQWKTYGPVGAHSHLLSAWWQEVPSIYLRQFFTVSHDIGCIW